MEDWSENELRASVDAYREMQSAERAGKKYSKRAVYRELAGKFGRTEKAFEYRMQNISAVLDHLKQPWIRGLKPATNVGPSVKSKLIKMLQQATQSRSPSSSSDYVQKLPAMRARLIGIARAGALITYGQLMTEFDLNRFVLRHAMSKLGWEAQGRGEPILTALIVDKHTGHCSTGLEKEFGVMDDEAERQRLYAFWKGGAPKRRILIKENDTLKTRASKFANVEIRPDQRAFRERVFLAYEGRCAISGCEVPSALDAAHVKGRDWREGHNRAADGILLRKDLHALYDAGLLRIDRRGLVEIDRAAARDYEEYAGTLLRRQR